jgi:small subunit ribosomal protein S3
MSVVKRIIRDSIEKVEVDELLADEYEQAGYGGITLTKTPLGTQINLFAMRPGRVIGKRGRAIKEASERLERELGLANPQITVVEVEVPELNPRIMAARVANALERGVHYRRALFWSLRRIMESGALGCEIVLRGKLRSDRSRYEKVSEGYIPKSGDPALTYVKSHIIHVKMKKGTYGVTVTIVPPDAKFPDKVSLEGLPEIEYPEEEYELPEGVEPEPTEPAPETAQAPVTAEAPAPAEPAPEMEAESAEEAAPAEEPAETVEPATAEKLEEAAPTEEPVTTAELETPEVTEVVEEAKSEAEETKESEDPKPAEAEETPVKQEEEGATEQPVEIEAAEEPEPAAEEEKQETKLPADETEGKVE